ncbi:hypothetical protein GOP47_0009093 [Adiantum capillus-veneris]|uniref:Protein kinase domain-containing protein n=1 Tax=Adiantum capillus-veneris TaxID=13818 RepID=A0A9D4V0H6_ADICA|nr:hypothetical protein GOP47_0009093 [Adiantum capillus-veneris]
MLFSAMRTQKQGHHPLLLLIPSSLTISLSVVLLHPLLLNVAFPLSTCNGPAVETPTCPASTNHSSICSSGKVNVSFPFLTSDECHDIQSSFIISNCNLSNEYPNWPSFTDNATKASPGLPTTAVVNIYSPLPTGNLSYPSGLPFDPRYGYIALTWNTSLLGQNTCGTLASYEEISQDIPQSINLQNFAHSAFNFHSATIILLFKCNATKEKSTSNLQMSSNACMAYEKECSQTKGEGYNCYQYMIPNPAISKELNLPQVMNASGCKQTMFFVALDTSLVLLTWKPGILLLNWNSTGTNWLASTFQDCVKCSSRNGSCGYNRLGNFACSCATNYSSENTKPASPSPHIAALPAGSPTSLASPQDISNQKSKKTLTIVILVGGLSAMALFMSLALLAMFCFFKKKKASTDQAFFSSELTKSWIKRPSFLSRKQDATLAREISFKELVCATETFADKNILGDGGYGAVYRGVLADGLQVAVKRLHHDNYRRIEHFYNEIKVLSNLNHPNLVMLFGFCACEDKRELLLVFEYASQGTVSDHLHGGRKPPMSWSLRLRIACETADALCYLHNAVVPPIYHRDVKTANILLDDAFHAKLADFGLSKLVPIQATHISTSPQGTPGYLDPEYHECYQLTDKSDVYSLGVVLMELVSGKLAVDMSRERGEINLSTLAVMKIQCGLLEELVDPQLDMKKDPSVERAINRVVELAFACLQGYRDDRPSMGCVAEMLAHIRREHEGGAIATQKKSPSSPPSVFFSSCDSSCASSTVSSS